MKALSIEYMEIQMRTPVHGSELMHTSLLHVYSGDVFLVNHSVEFYYPAPIYCIPAALSCLRQCWTTPFTMADKVVHYACLDSELERDCCESKTTALATCPFPSIRILLDTTVR